MVLRRVLRIKIYKTETYGMTQNRTVHAATRRHPEETEDQVRNKRGKVVSR